MFHRHGIDHNLVIGSTPGQLRTNLALSGSAASDDEMQGYSNRAQEIQAWLLQNNPRGESRPAKRRRRRAAATTAAAACAIKSSRKQPDNDGHGGDDVTTVAPPTETAQAVAATRSWTQVRRRFVILDDRASASNQRLMPHFVRTDPSLGLTDADVATAIAILSRDFTAEMTNQ